MQHGLAARVELTSCRRRSDNALRSDQRKTMAEEVSPFAALFGREEIDALMLGAEIGSKTYNETMKRMALGAQARQEAHAEQLAAQEQRSQQEQHAALYADLLGKHRELSIDTRREDASETSLDNLSTQVGARSEHGECLSGRLDVWMYSGGVRAHVP